jgi:hypothetical protein
MDESVEGKRTLRYRRSMKLKGKTDMNPNRYPGGRWTSRNRPSRRSNKIEPETLTALREARLRELFWAADESSLVLEARARIEAMLSSALAAAALMPIEIVDTAVSAGEALQAA